MAKQEAKQRDEEFVAWLKKNPPIRWKDGTLFPPKEIARPPDWYVRAIAKRVEDA